MVKSDNWLSEVMKRPVFRVTADVEETPSVFTAQLKADICARRLAAAFYYIKVPCSSIAWIQAIQSIGFYIVDTNITLEKPIHQNPKNSFHDESIRCSVVEDKEQVVELAQRSFTWSRFHQDPEIPAALAGRIKAEWVSSYYSGKRGVQMVVALKQDRISGFLQLLQMEQKDWVIDLIAVDAAWRGQGIASGMIQYAESLTKCPRYVVGTQLANTPALRLYEHLGFRCCCASHVLHYHVHEGAVMT